MKILLFSAAFVGFAHSMAPGHWLPVVLVSKAQRWNLRNSLLGALVAASGHIVVSGGLGLLSIPLGAHFLSSSESDLERYSGLGLLLFGLAYALYAWRRHSHCHGHSHHGPDPSRRKTAPYYFLFMVGFSPCVAALPVFAAASVHGAGTAFLTMVAFMGGVLAAFVGATLFTSLGLLKLDHPVFEHYGDVITGLGLAVMGGLLFCLGEKAHFGIPDELPDSIQAQIKASP